MPGARTFPLMASGGVAQPFGGDGVVIDRVVMIRIHPPATISKPGLPEWWLLFRQWSLLRPWSG